MFKRHEIINIIINNYFSCLNDLRGGLGRGGLNVSGGVSNLWILRGGGGLNFEGGQKNCRIRYRRQTRRDRESDRVRERERERERVREREREIEGKKEREKEREREIDREGETVKGKGREKKDYPLVSPVEITGIREGRRGGEGEGKIWL